MDDVDFDPMESDKKVTIHVNNILDCRSHSTFVQACRQADHLDIEAIVVDMNATQGIRASGLGMLLMLSDLGKQLRIQIQLENCNPQIKNQLTSSRLLTGLSIA